MVNIIVIITSGSFGEEAAAGHETAIPVKLGPSAFHPFPATSPRPDL